MIEENFKCEIPQEISETSLTFYFREKLLKLMGNSYYLSHIRYSCFNEISILYYRCRFNASNCKTRSMIIFDKKNKLANIYQNNEIHNHKDRIKLNQKIIRYSKKDVILIQILFSLINYFFNESIHFIILIAFCR